MQTARVYTYKNCDTCRKAIKWLQARGLTFTELPIREQPPTLQELKTMLEIYGGEVRKLFNTSGRDYKSLDLKDKLPGMTPEQAIHLLAENGNLVKRPFVLKGEEGVVGFKEDEWEKLFDMPERSRFVR